MTTESGFKAALKKNIRRPFLFGPIEFNGLNLTEEQEKFDYEEQRKHVAEVLQRDSKLPMNMCQYGYKVMIKNKNLKRRSTLLKHARFAKNLEVTPEMPPPPVEKVKEDENEEEGSGSDGE